MANNPQYPGIQQPPRPPVAAMGPPPNTYPSVPMQFRAAGPPRPPPPYMPIASQQFLAVGRPNMVSQPMQHLPQRPGPLGPPMTHSIVPPPPPPPPAAQAFSVPDVQPIRPVMSVSPQAQPAGPVPNNYGPGQSGPRAAVPLTYNLPTPAAAQVHVNTEVTSQYQPIASVNMPAFPIGGAAVTPVLQPAEQTLVASSVQVTSDLPKAVEKAASDWIEHTSHKGKRYYYNKKTKISSWEKPLELMSPTERADASTNWKEYPAPDGRKYYYNKVTKQSKWKIPDELKLAREQLITKTNTNEQLSTKDPDNGTVGLSATPGSDSPSSQAHELGSSPVPGHVLTFESTVSIESSKVTTNAAEETPMPETSPLSIVDNFSAKNAVIAENGNTEESNRGNTVTNDSTNGAVLEEKTVDPEIQVYETKEEAKNAFKALLENANVASDWTWDQAMRVIINDRRYGALRSLAERKQAFNEFIGQKKKQEAEQKRAKQKKAREEFKKMLEESKEITVSTKWSKASAIFENDDRFKAVERSKDREDLYDDYITELEKKERAKALEEHKKNRKEYIEFLKSCDFLTASSQWRRVQDRLEANESCMRLDKIDRLEIFQEYIRELEKDEEEQRKLRTEELRKTERKNRDEFRKLMDEHIASGTLTSKSHWRDYCIKVKDLPAYLAVASNSSGATPKDLFEDVLEELEKQYTEDRDRIKEIVKMKKVSILSTWTLEDFKNAIAEDISEQPVSDVNLKLVFDELLERVREREEKEAKRRKRVVDDFYTSLTTYKEITSSSQWEEFKPIFEDRLESWFSVEESLFKEMFDKYITELKKARDERKHREDKAKDRDRRRDKDNKSKRDKRRRDESRDSHRHSAERKKTKHSEQHSSASVDYESRHKRHKRDHRRDDQREAEDGEVW